MGEIYLTSTVDVESKAVQLAQGKDKCWFRGFNDWGCARLKVIWLACQRNERVHVVVVIRGEALDYQSQLEHFHCLTMGCSNDWGVLCNDVFECEVVEQVPWEVYP